MSCEFLTLFGAIPDEAVQTRLPAGTTVERVQIFKDSRLMRLALAFPVLVRGTAVEDVAAEDVFRTSRAARIFSSRPWARRGS